MNKLHFLPFVLFLAACSPATPTPTTSTGVSSGSGTAGTCASYCDHLRALDCKAGAPTPAGVSCEDVCTNHQANGIAVWDLSCRANTPNCDAVDRCEGH